MNHRIDSRVVILALVLTICAFAQAPQVSAVQRLAPDPALSGPLPFLVTFDQPVHGVDTSDFFVNTSLPGAAISFVESRGLDPAPRVIANPVQGFPTTAFSVEFWVQTTATSGTMLSYAISNAIDDEIRVSDPDSLDVWVHNVRILNSTVAINDAAWHHVAATWLSLTGDVKLYVDGVEVASDVGQAGMTLSDGGSFVIGQEQGGPGFGFSGSVAGSYDEVRVWNYARIGAEIQDSAAREYTGNESGLVLYWPLELQEDLGLGAAGDDDLRDLSPLMNHGQARGSPGTIVAGPPIDGYRWYTEVTLPSGSANGTVSLDVLADGSIQNAAGSALAAPFTSGESYTVQVANVLTVPGQYNAIQGALNNANPGDVILVSPGNYNQSGIDFLGKDVTVRSTGGAAVTTINAQGNGRVIKFENGEGPNAVLEGFTIKNGDAPNGTNQNVGQDGGGILIDGSSPTIRSCVISDNSAGVGSPGLPANFLSGATAGKRGGRGGGVFITGGSPLLADCRFENNSAGRGGQGGGGSSQFQPGPAGPGGDGGGVFVHSGAPVFLRCTFASNTAGRGGTGGAVTAGSVGGHGAAGGDGGGLAIAGGQITVEACHFTNNLGGTGGTGNSGGNGGTTSSPFGGTTQVGAGSGGDGGNGGRGGAIHQTGGTLTLVASQLSENAGGIGGAFGAGGFPAAGAMPPFDQPGLPGNPGNQGNGGAMDRQSGASTVLHCVFFANEGSNVGAIAGNVTVRNSIAVANTPTQIASQATVTYSLVQDGQSGLGNIQGDPLFVDPMNGDFHIQPGSPCADAGDPDTTGLPALDLDDEPRIQGFRVDIGLDEIATTNPYPGLGDDLSLTTLINGTGDPAAYHKVATTADVLTIQLSSPLGTFNGLPYLILAELYPAGSPPTGFLPGLHVSATNFVILFDSTTSTALPFNSVLGPGGITLPALVPPGLTGNFLILQGIVVSPLAQNAFFAPTDGHEIYFN